MKRKAIVLAAVLCIGVMSLTACSKDGKNNNSATDDRAGTSSIAPTASGDVIDDIGKDLKDGADDIGNDAKNGAGDVEKGVGDIGKDVEKGADDIGNDVKKGVDDLTGREDSSATGSPTMPTNNANDMVTSSPK